MPVTGVPLPFVSYGGTSMFAGMLAVGLLQNIHLRSHQRARGSRAIAVHCPHPADPHESATIAADPPEISAGHRSGAGVSAGRREDSQELIADPIDVSFGEGESCWQVQAVGTHGISHLVPALGRVCFCRSGVRG